MFKKLTFLLIALLSSTVWAVQPHHEVQIVDEVGAKVTTISSVHIYAPDSTTNAVIYMDRGEQNTITIPLTTTSTNTTLVDGFMSWYGPDGYNFSITDGTNIATNANHRARTSSEGRLVFPSYITAISSTTYADGASATWGTSPAFTQTIAAGVMTFTPGADNGNFVIGVSGTSLNSDFNVYVGTLLGLDIDAGDPSFKWDGGAVLLNNNSNFNVGINTGTSSGITSIGNSAGGGVAVDTDAGITVNADDSYALTVSAGTIGIAATGGDITIDGTDSSVIIDGAEAVDDAINIDSAAGGLDVDVALSIALTTTESESDSVNIDSAGGVDIDIAGGAAGEDFAVTTDTSITLVATEAVADQFKLDAQGAVAGNAINLETTSGGIILTADHASNGDITLDAEDDIIMTTTGKLTITNTEVVTISGGATITGVTTIASALVTPVEIVAATNEIEITESGTVYVLTHATEYATTLPTVATSAGVTFRFIVGAVPSGDDYTVVTDSLEDKISGSVTIDGAAVEATTDDTITFTRDAAAIGDWCELTSDGVLWYISGQGVAATAIVITGT